MSADGIAPPDEPPHDPWMDARVSRLEDDMGEIKATLRRLEPMIVRIDSILPFLATKADLMGVRSELKEETASFRAELKEDNASLRAELKEDNASLRAELKEDNANLRTELRQEITSVRTELKDEITSVRIALKDEIGTLRTELKKELSDVNIALADKPSRTYLWGVITAMVTAFACGLAGLAILK